MVCWRKGIGLHRGTTEKEFERRVNEYLDGRLQSTSAEQSDQHDSESDDAGETPADEDKKSKPKYSSQQVDEAATKLGLGETEYRLNWMPLGGYVKMLGQEDMSTETGEVPASQRHLSFAYKPLWQRIAIVAAGPIANFILAAFVFWVINIGYGVTGVVPVINGVVEDSPAYVAGLRTGDEILAVDGQETIIWKQVTLK